MGGCTRRASASSPRLRTCARSSRSAGAASSRAPHRERPNCRRNAPERGRLLAMDLIGILLGGLAAGMVLFIVSVGLSVTMGLMGFVNLAHGGFAMLGGYVAVMSMRHWSLPFPAALAL